MRDAHAHGIGIGSRVGSCRIEAPLPAAPLVDAVQAPGVGVGKGPGETGHPQRTVQGRDAVREVHAPTRSSITSLPVAGNGAQWIGDSDTRSLLKVVLVRPAPAPPAPPAQRRLVNGLVQPGEWHVDRFASPTHLTVDEHGWLAQVEASVVTLYRSDEPNMFVTITSPPQTFTKGQRHDGCLVTPAVESALRRNPRVRIFSRRLVSTGGVEATRLAIGIRTGRKAPALCGPLQCAPIFPFRGHVRFVASNHNRLYPLRSARRLATVSVEVPLGAPRRMFAFAESVVRNIRLRPPMTRFAPCGVLAA